LKSKDKDKDRHKEKDREEREKKGGVRETSLLFQKFLSNPKKQILFRKKNGKD
jgi:hypothetical protein